MLVHPQNKDPTDSKGGVVFCRLSRVPFPLFERLVEMTRATAWFSEKNDAVGQKCTPIENKLLEVLCVLGREYCIDRKEELSYISAEVNRVFFHTWCNKFAHKYFTIYCNPPETPEDIQKTMAVYDRLGFPGCIGITDCVHIKWERNSIDDRVLHKGKEGFPTLSYELTCDHTSKITSVTHGSPGTRSDRTIVRFDGHVSDIHDGVKYRDVKYKMRRLNGEEYEEQGAWLLVDGGYHKWRCLQCPLKHSALPKDILWSEWAETIRNDVECVFGV